MKTRSKWIAILIVLSLASAVVASLLTAVFLVRGLLGNSSSRWIALLAGQVDTTVQTGTSNQTTGSSGTTTVPDQTPIPTKTPTPSPTPSPTPKPPTPPLPTVLPTPTEPILNATESLYLWQTRQLVQRIYVDIASSVVGIYVEVPASGTQSARTNEGSGLIIDETGSVVTDSAILSVALNKQGKLIAGTRIDILVRGTERIFSAAYVGRDPITGLAVLNIDGGETTFVTPVFADSLDLKVGQMVLAVGYPDLMTESGGLSSGFISAINRMVILESGTSVQMIQTNLQISALCAGGPVLNLEGKVIGLSSCGLAKDPFDLKTYALPVDSMLAVAKGIMDQKAETRRAWLGITVLGASSFQELQRLYRFPDGLYISSVIQDSPAYVADLRKNDIIIQINDEPVFPSTDLSSFLKEQPVGATVKIRIFRRAENKTLDILVYLQESLR